MFDSFSTVENFVSSRQQVLNKRNQEPEDLLAADFQPQNIDPNIVSCEQLVNAKKRKLKGKNSP